MRTGRTILNLLIVLGLTLLPVAGAFALPKTIHGEHAAFNDRAMTTETIAASEHDCCDPEGMPAEHAMKECQAAAGCFAKCFNFNAVTISGTALHPPKGGGECSFLSKSFLPLAGPAPFRPPRV